MEVVKQEMARVNIDILRISELKWTGMGEFNSDDILECEVKWALGSVTMKKTSGGDGIPVELFQILKGDAMKELHSICQQI